MTIPKLLEKLHTDYEKSYKVSATQHFDWQTDFCWPYYTGFQLARTFGGKEVIAILELSDGAFDSEKEIVAFQPKQDMTLAEFFTLKKQYELKVSESNRWWKY